MKKISMEECYQTALVNLWNHIDALQKEVDRLEGVGSERKVMTVDEISDKLDPWLTETEGQISAQQRMRLYQSVQPLTVQQVFVPDWSIAPESATQWACGFLNGPSWCSEASVTFIPRPAPKTREMTAREKNTALRDFICLNPNFDFGDASTVEEMLTRANISLTVTEE